MSIRINVPSRTVGLYCDDRLVKDYPAAVGKPSTPTPLGTFRIVDKEINPIWYPPGLGFHVLSGPANPLGYRWLGFAATYGIHGTNAPWTIGQAVSNGCVRMKEEDVEDLFDAVPIETPVVITYDRSQVGLDHDGRVVIRLFPDVYGYGGLGTMEIRSKLAAIGVGDFFDNRDLTDIIRTFSSEQSQIIGQVHNIEINNERINQLSLTVHGETYLPVSAINQYLPEKLNIRDSDRVIWRQHQARLVVKNGKQYITATELKKLFSQCLSVDDQENVLRIRLSVVLFNGDPEECDVWEDRGERWVSAFSLSKLTGKKICWNPHTEWLQAGMKEGPVRIIKGVPYLNREGMRYLFAVDWIQNHEQEVIEMKFPYYPLDYSMYLDEMGDFQ